MNDNVIRFEALRDPVRVQVDEVPHGGHEVVIRIPAGDKETARRVAEEIRRAGWVNLGDYGGWPR